MLDIANVIVFGEADFKRLRKSSIVMIGKRQNEKWVTDLVSSNIMKLNCEDFPNYERK